MQTPPRPTTKRISPALARSLIGRQVEWEYAHDRRRGTCLSASGVIEQVDGKNILISGDWKWIRDLCNLKTVSAK